MENIQQQTATEQSNGRLSTWQPQPQSNAILGWMVEQLTILAEAMGETMTPARLKIYVSDLVGIEQESLATAFQRARRECRFFPKIAELRELAVGRLEQQQDAEARKAWDVLMGFVNKYVGNDVHGNYGPEHGWYSKTPRLSARILDTVRRTGGWRAYKCITQEDYPFQQKRFFEEYAAWTAVEQIPPSKLLTEMPRLQIVAKAMDSATVKESPTAQSVKDPTFKARPIQEPDERCTDSRQTLNVAAAGDADLGREGRVI